MKRTIRRILSVVIAIAITVSFVPTVLAVSLHENGDIHVAYVKNINANGSNIGTEYTNPESVINMYDITYELDASGLNVSGHVEGVNFIVDGNIVTTNQNANLLLYSGQERNGDFDVVYLSVERDLPNTTLFFDSFYETNCHYLNVIKLYLQPKGSDDLIFIEIFIEEDFVFLYLQNHCVPYDADKANEMQLWFVALYDPVVDYQKNEECDETITYSNFVTSTLNLSKTYSHMGATVNINFKARLYYTLSDLNKFGSGQSTCYFHIIESNITSDVAAYNSSTQNYIQLENLNIKYATMPGVILVNQQALRKNVLRVNGGYAPSFSVSISVDKGPLNVSGTWNFDQNVGTMSDTNIVGLPYASEYTRSTECGSLPSSYCLRDYDSMYGFVVNYQDVAGNSGSGTVKVRFEYTVINSWNYTDNIVASTTKNITLNIS